MKTIEEYLRTPYRMELIEDPDEGGYTVSFPDLPGCLTCGETLQEAFENATDAKRAWIEATLESGMQIPEPRTEGYSGQFKLRLPKSLHRILAETAKREGISMNQYCIFLLSQNNALMYSTKALNDQGGYCL